MAASTDSWHVHRAWLETSSGLTGIRYPVLADPDQELTRAYGVLNMDDGSALPATFIIDPSGTVRDTCLAGPGTRAPAGGDARGAARAAHERAPGRRLTLRG